MDEKYLTASEASRQLGISIDYLYRLVWSAKLPAHKEADTWRISASAVRERVAKRQAKRESVAVPA